MRTVADLLSHYPRRYARRGELTALANLPLDENVTIVAEVAPGAGASDARAARLHPRGEDLGRRRASSPSPSSTRRGGRRELVPGVRGIFAGKVSDYRGALQLAHPDYELFEPDAENALTPGSAAAKSWAMTPIPIYPGDRDGGELAGPEGRRSRSRRARRRAGSGAGRHGAATAVCCRSGRRWSASTGPRRMRTGSAPGTRCGSRRRSSCRRRCCSSVRVRAAWPRRRGPPCPAGSWTGSTRCFRSH